MEDHHLGLLLSECYVALVQGMSNFKFPCHLVFFMDSMVLNRLIKVRKCVNWLLEPYLFTAFISLFSDWTTWRWMLNTIFYCWMVSCCCCCCCFNLFQSLFLKPKSLNVHAHSWVLLSRLVNISRQQSKKKKKKKKDAQWLDIGH